MIKSFFHDNKKKVVVYSVIMSAKPFTQAVTGSFERRHQLVFWRLHRERPHSINILSSYFIFIDRVLYSIFVMKFVEIIMLEFHIS